MVLTNDARLAKRIRRLRTHGITGDAEDMHPRAPEEIWNYQQIDLGFNYRMTDIQAALGMSQMRRLNEFVAKRHSLALRYDELLANIPVVTPWQHREGYSGYHLYVTRLKLGEISKTHREVFEALRTAGIIVNLHYIPVYRHPYYADLGFEAGHCPEAERHYSEAISLPLYPGLTESQQDKVIATLRQVTAK